jgi:hypothetical protein
MILASRKADLDRFPIHKPPLKNTLSNKSSRVESSCDIQVMLLKAEITVVGTFSFIFIKMIRE